MLRPTSPPSGQGEPVASRGVGIAFVGLGYWGLNLPRVISDSPDAEVKWIGDLDRERLERYRRRHLARAHLKH